MSIANPSPAIQNYLDRTYFVEAAINGQLGLMSSLLPKVDLDTKNEALSGASQVGQTESVKRLLAAGANQIDHSLFFAAQDGQVEVVKLLLESSHGYHRRSQALSLRSQAQRSHGNLGTEIHSSPDGNNRALHVASKWGHIDVMKLLLEYGVDQMAKNKALDLAYYAKRSEGSQAQAQRSPVITEVVEVLLEHGAERCQRFD